MPSARGEPAHPADGRSGVARTSDGGSRRDDPIDAIRPLETSDRVFEIIGVEISLSRGSSSRSSPPFTISRVTTCEIF